MNPIVIVIIAVVIVITLVLIFWPISIYNGLIALRNRFQNAYSQIDVQLKRRYDLIPNLVEVAKGYMAHERETLEAVIRAHDRLVQSIERSEFATVLDVLVNGDDGEVNEVRALQLLADHGGATVTSRPLAQLYGFSSHSRVRPALERLRGRGLVDQREDGWYIVDPLFNEWLRRASPLADRPLLEPPDDD